MIKKPRFLLISIISAIAVIVIVFVIIFTFFHPKAPVIPPKPLPEPKYAYGICIDSLSVTYGTVGKNQVLSTILSDEVSAEIIYKIASGPRDLFDVRKIRTGNRYAFITTRDSIPKALYFVYELNPIEYIVYDFRDSLRIYTGKKDLERKIKTASGIIYSSLWNTIADNKMDVNLALNLSDVFAWTVDFYGLQKGDGFKVIYEEVYVDSILTGSDKILAALFHSNGKDLYAFYFNKEGAGDYFDEAGNSLERSFLKAPLRFSRISSRFSKARMHPILRIVRPHYGVDYAAPRGTPVVALGDGHVVDAGFHGGYGRFISIRHNSVYTTTYAHLSGYAKGIHSGSNVRQGDVIGYVGSSGLATGPHLDFRVYKNGAPVNPLSLESPPAKPVNPGYLQEYNKLVKDLKAKLDSVR